MLPIAPNHIALEGATRADRHRQNIAWLWDGLELNPFAKSNVIVCDGFRSLLPLAADAEGRNPQTNLDCLRHLLVTSLLSCMIARVAVLPSPVGATAVLLTLDPLTTWQRRFVTLDDLADEAGLMKGEFLAAIVRAAGGVRVERAITDLLVASAFPNVVAACVKRAQTLAGIADRQLLFEHMSATSMNMALEEAAQKARQRQGIMERHLASLLEDRIDGDH